MASMLNLETSALPKVESRDVKSRDVESRDVESRDAIVQDPAPQAVSATTATTDYEIVLGRAQIASWLFVGVIAVAICSSLAYLAGEKITAKKTAAISRLAAPLGPMAPPPVAASAELPQASILVTPKADLASLVKNQKSGAPLFAEPEMGKVYIQTAAVERGMALLITEGLRSHGFDCFVAPGPNDKVFRVLIGPLPDPAAFRQAMVTVNALDLANFARKYEK
jgi:cell division septation protein DedD